MSERSFNAAIQFPSFPSREISWLYSLTVDGTLDFTTVPDPPLLRPLPPRSGTTSVSTDTPWGWARGQGKPPRPRGESGLFWLAPRELPPLPPRLALLSPREGAPSPRLLPELTISKAKRGFLGRKSKLVAGHPQAVDDPAVR
eukprot:1352106-Rhodomonas_salina.2